MENTRELIKQFLIDFTAKHHYAPTVEEIRAGCGLKSKSHVYYYIKQLVIRGEIRIDPGKARSIVVVEKKTYEEVIA
jgi:repressor LexA